jgi:hypothetical protein
MYVKCIKINYFGKELKRELIKKNKLERELEP